MIMDMAMWMAMMTVTVTICTIFAFTALSTCNSWIETLAVFFLALAFFTVASLSFACWDWLCLDNVFCTIYQFKVMLVVATPVARTLWSAHFSRWKTLAIHLEAFSFFTSATSFLLFYVRCWGYSFMVCML